VLQLRFEKRPWRRFLVPLMRNCGGERKYRASPKSIASRDETRTVCAGAGVFGSTGNARTFDFRAGDVGCVPFAMGHYVENTTGGRRRHRRSACVRT
jgi:hypothetical protein